MVYEDSIVIVYFIMRLEDADVCIIWYVKGAGFNFMIDDILHLVFVTFSHWSLHEHTKILEHSKCINSILIDILQCLKYLDVRFQCGLLMEYDMFVNTNKLYY